MVHPPYMDSINMNKPYTLVLDLDETLIHYFDQPYVVDTRQGDQKQRSSGLSLQSNPHLVVDDFGAGYFMIRPGAREFLKLMAQRYEVVIWTAALQEYADWVIDNLDTAKSVQFRFYR